MDGYWFKSTKFEIEPGEDEEINPGIYGRQLARWLKERLQEKGYAVEDIFNEDWGRCLMCRRDPFMLWVGCANMDTNPAADEQSHPTKEQIVWHCFVVAEVPFFKRLFRKVDTQPMVDKLNVDIAQILRSEPTVTLVEQPKEGI